MRTPSGAIAVILAIYIDDAEPEALVRWPNSEIARFRLKLLRPLPGAPE